MTIQSRLSRLVRHSFPLLLLLTLVLPGAAQAPQPYRILVTNDDGIRAPGLAALIEALAPLGEITVVAPDEGYSGTGHAITLSGIIYVDDVTLAGGRRAISVSGPPATCVRLALAELLPERPHLVVSGVNRGSNYGMNAYISGTVGAAREAAMQGIPAIATSLDIAGHPEYGPAADMTARVVEIVKREGLPAGVFLNVSAPPGPIKGLRVAWESRTGGAQEFVERRSPRGRRYFWPMFEQPTGAEPGSDIQAVLDGYVAVTPLLAYEGDETTIEALERAIEATAGTTVR